MATRILGAGGQHETLKPIIEEELTNATERELTRCWDKLVITKVEDTLLPTVAASREEFDTLVRIGASEKVHNIESIKVSCKIGSVADKDITDENIATRIFTKEVYQNVFRSQQQKALRDASALARASLKQIPDRNDRRIAFDQLEKCLKRCPPDALGFDKTAYAGCLNTQAFFYLSGMPLCDSKTSIKRATALFEKAANLGDDAEGSADYHLAKGFFFLGLIPQGS